MAVFSGWTAEELALALERANEHFNNNLEYDRPICTARMSETGKRYRLILKPTRARRLKRVDIEGEYAKLISNIRGELLPDFLYPPGVTVHWGDAWYSKAKSSGNMACWHAHGRLYRELFKINPEGKITTSIAKYHGVDGFEDNFEYTATHNKGSAYNPRSMADNCCCDMYEIGDF